MASAEKHGIIFEWVAGTSVGALNGALVLMDDIEAAEQLWTNISSEQVLQYPKAAAKKRNLIRYDGAITLTRKDST